MFEMETMYREIGIRKSVLDFGKKIEERLSERFQEIDKIAEYNQLKVIHAMQEKRVSADCFHYASGYGYDDHGRDTLEEVYAAIFHTESALVRPQIACGTHALALALSANLRPGDELLSPGWKTLRYIRGSDWNWPVQGIFGRIRRKLFSGGSFGGWNI